MGILVVRMLASKRVKSNHGNCQSNPTDPASSLIMWLAYVLAKEMASSLQDKNSAPKTRSLKAKALNPKRYLQAVPIQ